MLKTTLLIFGIIIIIPFSLYSTVINVPGDQPTIQAGIGVSTDGDTVLVGPGTYAENIDYPTHRIIVKSSEGADVTFLTYTGDASSLISVNNSDSGSVFEGFSINGLTGTGYLFNAFNVVRWFEVKNNKFLNNDFVNILRSGNSASLCVYNNLFDNPIADRMVSSTGANCRFINNTVVSGEKGIAISGENSIILNNIIINVDDYALWEPDPTSLVDYNDFWNNGSYNNPGPNGISIDPLLIDPNGGNYGLQANSPSIDAGNPAIIYNDPDGSRNDIGAYPLNEVTPPLVTLINYGVDADEHVIFDYIPEIYWNYYPDGYGQVEYHIQIGTDDEWSVAEMWDTGPISSSDESAIYDGTSLQDNTKYYLRIRVNNGLSWGDWVSSWFFVHTNNIINIPGNLPSIQEAIEIGYDNDTILVGPGTYTEYINLLGKKLSIISTDGPEVTVIQSPANRMIEYAVQQTNDSGKNSNEKIRTMSMGSTVTISSAEPKGTLISGFTITGGAYSGIYCEGSSPNIINNILFNNHSIQRDGGGAIDLIETNGSLIKGNKIYSNSAFQYGAAIHLAVCNNDTICYNLIYDNSGIGDIRSLSSNTYIYNNTIIASSLDGIINQGGIADIRNNIIINAPRFGIYGENGGEANVSYNCTWNCAVGDYGGGDLTIGIGAIYDYPIFVDTLVRDYNLVEGSPCIDAGDPDNFFFDSDGSRNDVGALPWNHNFPIPVNINIIGENDWNVANHSPIFNWVYFGYETNQDYYEIEIGTDNNWDIAEMWLSGIVVSADLFANYIGSELLDGNTYYYRQRLGDVSGWGDWIEFIFRMNSVPSMPVPVWPIEQSGINVDNVVLVIANSIDNENDDITYDYEIYSDNLLTELVIGEYGLQEQEVETIAGPFVGLDDYTEYWWRCRAFDSYEYSNWSSSESFIVRGPGTISVPEHFDEIQNAINIAYDNDTVLVAPGVYYENIDFLGKSITVLSSDGPAVTEIGRGIDKGRFNIPYSETSDSTQRSDDPNYRAPYRDPIVSFISGESGDAELTGFTIRNGNPGIYCRGSSPKICNNIICENISSHENVGAGVDLEYTTGAIITNNIFHSNIAESYGAAIHLYRSNNDTISYNIIYENSGYGEIRIFEITDNIKIYNNTISASIYSGITHQASGHVDLRNNIIFGAPTVGVRYAYGSITAEYNCLFNNNEDFDFTAGEGNIYQDALFEDIESNNYNLLPASPCIDTGDPDLYFNDPDETRNDIGAIYYKSICGDLDDNGFLNILDVVFLINYKYKEGPAPTPLESADVNSDTSVDILDAVYLINSIYKEGPEPVCP